MPYRYLSFGGGVQSTAMLLLADQGEIDCPDVALFADTQCEPQWVYDHIERVRAAVSIPIETVTAGSLTQDAVDRHQGKRSRFAAIPAWTLGSDGRAAPLRRQCTREYKIDPMERWVRNALGYRPRQRVKINVECFIGISTDEWKRMKPNRTAWIKNRFPLIERGLSRSKCVEVIQASGIQVPWKSSCYCCPFHSNEYWRQLRDREPKAFEQAASFDSKIRDMSKSGVDRPVYLHRSCRPLSEVDLTDGGQTYFDFFDAECEGMCGT